MDIIDRVRRTKLSLTLKLSLHLICASASYFCFVVFVTADLRDSLDLWLQSWLSRVRMMMTTLATTTVSLSDNETKFEEIYLV